MFAVTIWIFWYLCEANIWTGAYKNFVSQLSMWFNDFLNCLLKLNYFYKNFWKFIISIHKGIADAQGKKYVSPNLPWGNKKNYLQYSKTTPSGVPAHGVIPFLVLGKRRAISKLFWEKLKVALDFGAIFNVNYPDS